MSPLWLALLVGFALSPVLFDTARHLAEEPWKLPAAVLVPLLVLALVRAERADPAPFRRSGAVAMGLAIALEFVALMVGEPAWARLGLALAAFGWLRAFSLGSAPSAALLFLAIPPPTFASLFTSPELEEAWCHMAAAVLPGVEVELFPVAVHPGDGGIAMVMLGAALAGWRARWLGRSGNTTAIWAACGAVVGLACQPLGFVAAGWLGARGAPQMARHFLDLGPGLLLATAVVLSVGRRRPTPINSRPEPA